MLFQRFTLVGALALACAPVHAIRPLGSSFGVAENATYDYIVVGGGTAGLAVATRLAQNSENQVAVIEAGSFYEISNGNISQIPVFSSFFSGKSISSISPLTDWGFLTTPQPVRYIADCCSIVS